ncbi:MAG: DinB/UmuC family translesion DNA polymerase [Burkholderiaceae bacterium]
MLHVFIMTNYFRPDQPQYCPNVCNSLPAPTASTLCLQQWAIQGLKQIYRTGYFFKKAGVMLSQILPAAQHQGDLF